MDRAGLADFLRQRREALQPEAVGLGRGARRRTSGLRREQVAALSQISADYYSRLEQRRGPQPSEQVLAAIARGLRLTRPERDHLFRLAGHTAPPSPSSVGHVSPALLRILDRLDAPAEVITGTGGVLVQNALAVALLGDRAAGAGLARNAIHRWFVDPQERRRYAPEDHDGFSRGYVATLRAARTRFPDDPGAGALVEALRRGSAEFARLWDRHEVAACISGRKRLLHPVVGTLELDYQVLTVEDETQVLLVYSAAPGSEDDDKLRLLSVVGTQVFGSAS